MDSLPRTSSGEVDRAGLPLPVLPGDAVECAGVGAALRPLDRLTGLARR